VIRPGDAGLRPVIEHVLDARGIDLAGMGQRLADSVAQRMDVLGAADEAAYVDVLRERPAEVALLFDALLADRSSVDWSYDVYPRIEERFLEALDESLRPRGPEVLYEMVGRLGLPPGSAVADVGCGEGRYTVLLAERFGFDVVGVDIVQRHLDRGNQALVVAAERDLSLRGRVRFALGDVEGLPVEDGALDLVWFRDVLEHVEHLDRAFAEFHRVLRAGGNALVYSTFADDGPLPDEVEWMWRSFGNTPDTLHPAAAEAAMAVAGFRIEERVLLGSEWGEFAEEREGAATRRLLHTARMLRARDRYVEQFGQSAYDIMLCDCFWHVYRMLGKLEGRVYLLSKPA
jgi:SAM-dependent methyltransferase